ncbi:ribosome maturation protein [Aspergillus transmontanensis]|uniref:Ribosome maturation protein n=1 Tax=Aspergillus transmontanensis TaxID=1034304 RepID=A0A5N6VU98_9EURO|nr:ribosome maturation protein [Aspergillus transmontanensis]
MPRGRTSEVLYKGRTADFRVFVNSLEILDEWRNDPCVPLTDVVPTLDVFLPYCKGLQQRHSISTLEDEFGTRDETECILKILRDGKYQSN